LCFLSDGLKNKPEKFDIKLVPIYLINSYKGNSYKNPHAGTINIKDYRNSQTLPDEKMVARKPTHIFTGLFTISVQKMF